MCSQAQIFGLKKKLSLGVQSPCTNLLDKKLYHYHKPNDLYNLNFDAARPNVIEAKALSKLLQRRTQKLRATFVRDVFTRYKVCIQITNTYGMLLIY